MVFEAAKIWEPELDLVRDVCKHPNNVTLHGLLAWLYLDRGDFSQAENQTRKFLAREVTDSERPEYKNYDNLNRFVLSMALLRQHRNVEAIEVLENLIAGGVSPEYRMKPLFALRQLYVWEKDEAGLKNTNLRIITTCDEADIGFIQIITEEQQAALIDFSEMKRYIRRCKERLDNGEARDLLKELPPLVLATRFLEFSHRDDPVLLCLLAMANRYVGNCDSAIRTFQYVRRIDQRPKNQGIVLLEMGKTYLDEGKSEEAAKAFEEAYHAGGQRDLGTLMLAATAHRLMGAYDRALLHLETIMTLAMIKNLLKHERF